MKLLMLIFSLCLGNLLFSQDSIFGTYELKTSMPGDSTGGTILQIKCDYTYFRADSVSSDWGKWELKKNGDFILSIDTMSANGRTERHNVKVYYKTENGQLKLTEKHYSKKAFREEIKSGNERFRMNNLPFKLRYSEEKYEKWRNSVMALYFVKLQSLTCP